ncbi:MAG: response regulator, partial [Chloroflexus sp.]|nr:response regulator [Chloroflexus sp.]
TIVKNQLEDARRRNQLHPVTNLPTAELLNEQLRQLLTTPRWGLLNVHINGFETFTQVYGAVVGEDVLRFVALMLNEIVSELGGNEEFIGQQSVGQSFIITTIPERIQAICDRIITRFDDEIGLHYNYRHRKQGYIEFIDDSGETRQAPLMSLSVGVLTHEDGPFADIRELSEAAEEVRQRALVQAREQGKRSFVAYGRS